MSLFKLNRGSEVTIPTDKHDGWAYFCTDTGSLLIDHPNTEGTIIRSKISAKYADKLRYVEDGETIEINADDIVTQENLEDVISTVLAQAKASGEFDGASVTIETISESSVDGGNNIVTFSDGMSLTVKNGSQGKPGSDGVSATHSWNGTILTITSASGTSSADLKGDKGDAPIKGADYWTEADKTEIVNGAKEAISSDITSGILKLLDTGGGATGTFQYNYTDNLLTIRGKITQPRWNSETAGWSFNAAPLCYEDGTTFIPIDFFPSVIPPSEGAICVPGYVYNSTDYTPGSAALFAGGNYITMNWGYWNPGDVDTSADLYVNITLFGIITV